MRGARVRTKLSLCEICAKRDGHDEVAKAEGDVLECAKERHAVSVSYNANAASALESTPKLAQVSDAVSQRSLALLSV